MVNKKGTSIYDVYSSMGWPERSSFILNILIVAKAIAATHIFIYTYAMSSQGKNVQRRFWRDHVCIYVAYSRWILNNLP